MVISLVLPRITHIGAGVREQLPFILEQLNVKRPLIVTDRTMSQQALASGSPANNPGNPTDEDIRRLYAEIWD